MHSLPPVDYAARRRRVMDEIGDEALLVLFSSPERRRSHDTYYRYRQSSDVLYLCGFEEPEAILVLAPGAEEEFVLFVRPRDRERETWDGFRAGPEGAIADYGADAAYTVGDFATQLPTLMAGRRKVYHVLGKSRRDDEQMLRAMRSLAGSRRSSDRSPEAIYDPLRTLHRMRMVKDAAEIARVTRAAEISAAGHLAAMQQTRPNMMEYEVEAILTAAYRSRGAEAHAYEPIVAGGSRSCVLHYNENDGQLRDGEMVLIDSGAEFLHYAGDITRTWPVGASFTGPQKAIYEAVLSTEKFGISLTVAGESNISVHEATVAKLTEHMLDIGLLSGSLDEALEKESYREYYMHGTGHYLGMDVHDVGEYRRSDETPFVYEEGMILTVEPGIYVRADSDAPEHFRGIGVRIEDDVLIGDPVLGKNGVTVLTHGVPKEVDDIEALRREAISSKN